MHLCFFCMCYLLAFLNTFPYTAYVKKCEANASKLWKNPEEMAGDDSRTIDHIWITALVGVHIYHHLPCSIVFPRRQSVRFLFILSCIETEEYFRIHLTHYKKPSTIELTEQLWLYQTLCERQYCVVPDLNIL